MANIVRRRQEPSELEQRRGGGPGWDPFRTMRDLFQWDPFSQLDVMPRAQPPVFIPDIDLRESAQEYFLKVDLPGLKEDDVEISVTGNRLTIGGRREPETGGDSDRYFLCERPAGVFSRTVILPEDCDSSQIRAEMANGVLTISIPKRPEVQPRRIQLGRGQQGDGGGAPQQQAQKGKS